MSSVQRLPHRCNDSRGMSAFLLVFLSIKILVSLYRSIERIFDAIHRRFIIIDLQWKKKKVQTNQSYLHNVHTRSRYNDANIIKRVPYLERLYLLRVREIVHPFVCPSGRVLNSRRVTNPPRSVRFLT